MKPKIIDMMRYFPKILVFVTTLLLSVACVKKEPDPGTEPNTHEDANANEWIYSTMVAEYLYNTRIKALDKRPSYNQSSEDFFTSLLSANPEDNDGKHAGTNSYFYSYMERVDTKTKVNMGNSLTYGFEYIFYGIKNSSDYAARVLMVYRGSPADQAGLKRGDWIIKMGNQGITSGNWTELQSGGAVALSIERANIPLTLNMPAAATVSISPVFLDTVYTLGADRIGYVVYNGFERGIGEKDYTFDNELRDAFGRLSSQNVTDLIVDLRYNPGGYVDCCQLLCSMIVPTEFLGTAFIKYEYNSNLTLTAARKYETSKNFLKQNEVSSTHLNLSRVYVLTGKWTASASELLINALRPCMEVIQVGAKTEGKNVGSLEYKSTYGITLHPIVVRILNRNNLSDYKNGFTPSTVTDELVNMDDMYPLGDGNEYLLKTTLGQITGVTTPGRAVRSVSPYAGFEPTGISSIDYRRVRGAILNNVER